MENQDVRNPVANRNTLNENLSFLELNENKQIQNTGFSMTKWLDKNGRYIQWGVYGLGVSGLIVSVRSIRLATRFTDAKNIPMEFYDKNISLYGHVQKVNITMRKTSGEVQEVPVFLVQHNPIMMALSRGFRRPYENFEDAPSELIRIEVPGLNVHAKYLEEVDRELKNQIIQFTLLRHDEIHNSALCVINTKGYIFYRKNFAAWCIQNRYASVGAVHDNSLFNSSKFRQYYKRMGDEEDKSSKREERFYRRLYDAVRKLFQPRKHG